tara:strand:- start:104 stop:598 length:495 start_codon:yes stop_codon:yes gene_type:complete
MIIYLKNKHTLIVEHLKFKCSIGRKGLSKSKVEGDKKTPIGLFELGNVYYREDKIKLPKIRIHSIKIKPQMGWCDDIKYPKKYNKLIKIAQNIHHERLYRKDRKYDLLIPIKYNSRKVILGKGSCIFLHLTSNYNPTAGCIAIKKKDFLIMLKLLTKKTKIKIN